MNAEPIIYVVDDHPAVCESLQALLGTAGYHAVAFSCAADFLAALNPDRHGCLLLDLRLPDMNGIEVQKRLVELGARLKTVMISGHGDVALAVKAMKAGAIDFIEKPCSDDTILDAVREALRDIDRLQAVEETRRETTRRIRQLTPREMDVLKALVSGQPNKQIAHHLDISPRTVEIHRARVMSKMSAPSLSHLVRMAMSVGIEEDSTDR